ncbi:MAG: hypothetical protein CVU64_11440 [Deltaproteobacteria bacterium HGW-Deltaproteobacteria-21]|jgi:hypothetical protein|nr:MAG: hypothetical protein CVU64_11440 [Deltaproteobacteria bacterium HGW-Deltaproteobacteria-21]
MKSKNLLQIVSFMLILGLGFSNALAGSVVTYLGKTTWTAKITQASDSKNIGGTFTVVGGITKVGDEFYAFQGYVTSDSDGPFVMSGSGFLMGTTLLFTLSESQEHTDNSWRDSGVMRVSMDQSTLNGTFYDIGLDYNTDTKMFDQRFSAGTLTRTGGYISLTSSTAATDLLLQD